MEAMSEPGMDSLFPKIRRLRKKLRQIESLYHLDRDWTDEEWEKVKKKEVFLAELQKLLAVHSEVAAEQGSSKQEIKRGVVRLETREDASYHTTPEHTDSGFDSAPPPSDVMSGGEGYTGGDEDEGNALRSEQVVFEDNVAEAGNLGATAASSLPHSQGEPEEKEVSAVTSPPQKEDKRERKEEKPKQETTTGKVKQKEKAKKGAKRDLLPLACVDELEGHNDLVTCAFIEGDTLVTGSRDTTVRIWSLDDMAELQCCGGHTGAVTAVLLLPSSLAGGGEGQVVVSGAADSSVKIWHVTSGRLVRSIYIYSPVTSLGWLSNKQLLVVTAESGKLALWDLTGETSEPVVTKQAHEEAITAATCVGDHVWTGGVDGSICLHQVTGEGGAAGLSLQYEREEGRLELGSVSGLAAASRDGLYVADAGVNVKHLGWRHGMERKLRNHTCEVGRTGCVCVSGDKLLASGFNVDSGSCFVNVLELESQEYQYTLDDGATGPVLCLTHVARDVTTTSCDVVVTGGKELKVWRVWRARDWRTAVDPEATANVLRYDQAMTGPPVDTDDEDDSDEEEAEEGERVGVRRQQSQENGGEEQSRSWWWCNVL